MIKRKLLYFLLLIISITGILVCPYGILNTMVSLKYETENPGDCISIVSGVNLCLTIRILQVAFVICFILLVCLIQYREKILNFKSNKKNRI